MSWMKAYPKEHDPCYYYILVNYIISRLPSMSETDRQLCQMVAFKFLATAATDTRGKKESLVCYIRILEGKRHVLTMHRTNQPAESFHLRRIYFC